MKINRLFLFFLSYLIGAVIGLFLVVTVTWADMEAASYGFQRLASGGLKGVSCPAWMTRRESGTVVLNVSNPTDTLIRPAVRAEISTPAIQEEFIQNVELAPGESKKLEWRVGPENIDMKRFIFAKFLVYAAHPLPSRETTCGIYIVDLPGSSRVILPLLVTLSLLGMGWGLYGMKKWGQADARVLTIFRSLALLASLVVIGLVVSLAGWWASSVLVLALFLLVTMIRLGTISSEQRR